MSEHVAGDVWPKLYLAHVKEWTRRFADACRACRVDGVVVFSGAIKRRYRDDIEIPFVAEPFFRVWVPHAYPDAALRIVPGEAPRLVYCRNDDFWTMPPPEPGGFWTDGFDIREVASMEALLIELGDLSVMAGLGESADDTTELASANDATLLSHLDFHRAYKTPYEVACIEQANRIAARGQAAAHRLLADRPSEFELNETYCRATGQRESALPYLNVVAVNEHAGILHYQELDRHAPPTIHSFLLDAGAYCNGYASDVTRTSSAASDEFSDLILSMDAMQQQLCAEARPGVNFVTLNERAHQLLAEVLTTHGLTRCAADETYDRGITRAFLPHGLGHLLGLQVHDAGGRLQAPGGPTQAPPREHPFLRLTRILEPGFVVTVEPGIYFIPTLLHQLNNGSVAGLVNWQRVEQFVPCGGIRVEDDVLVTESESVNLTRPALRQAGFQ